jgi:hypothetical protein
VADDGLSDQGGTYAVARILDRIVGVRGLVAAEAAIFTLVCKLSVSPKIDIALNDNMRLCRWRSLIQGVFVFLKR